MLINTVFTLVILIVFVSIAIVTSKEMSKNHEKGEDENLIDDFHPLVERHTIIADPVLSETHYQKKNQREDFYKDADFVNKGCKNLNDFVINDDINVFDLKKLADLNGISLQIHEGWYPLVIKLIKELHDNGWDKRVYCIKTKYAFLEFYASNEEHLQKIIRGYGFASQSVCETCGERGEMRYYSGWDYIDCRKHYLEKRGKITLESEGFWYEDFFYQWKAIIDRSFEEANYFGQYRTLVIEFDKTIQNERIIYGRLSIPKSTLGFGNLVDYLSKNFYRSKHSYIAKFENVEFCKICGYKAVYIDQCECCENYTWESYFKRSGNEEHTEEEKHEYIKDCQISWIKDEGEIYEAKQNNYTKNSSYKVLYNVEELNNWDLD